MFNSEQGLGFDLAYRPGSLKEMLKQMASGNPDETYEPMPMQPEFQERAPRLRLLAEQGVDQCVLYPSTMALSVEQYVKDTPVAVRQHPFVQPMVRRDVGLRRRSGSRRPR